MTPHSDGELLDKIAARIRRQAEAGDARICRETLRGDAPWSQRQMERRFRERFLTSPGRYFRDCQEEIAQRLLQNGQDVLSAALQAGFASPGRLHETMVRRRGMTPGQVRRKGEGVMIRYGFFDTPIGVALIGATERGVCSLRLCQFDGAARQLAEFQNDFRAADFVESPDDVQPYADELVAFLEKRADSFQPCLDILRGTTFQREVWAELQRVGPGETVSYAELAKRIGKPSAVRAVAGACAANSLAIAIPCHRVLAANGSLSGYRWGKDWKGRLLALEKQAEQQQAALAL